MIQDDMWRVIAAGMSLTSQLQGHSWFFKVRSDSDGLIVFVNDLEQAEGQVPGTFEGFSVSVCRS